MAAYTSVQHTNSPLAFTGGGDANMIAFHWQITVSAALTASDTFTFGRVPKGFRVLGGCLEASDMEAGTGVTLSVGDAGSAARLFSAATVAQAGTASTTVAVAGQHFLYTDDTIITGAAGGSVTTGATGTINLSLYGRFEGSAS